MQDFGLFSRTSIFNSHHNSKIRKNTAQATTARRTYECTSARSHTHHRRAARPHVCRRVCSTCKHMQSCSPRKGAVRTALKCGMAPRGSRGRRIAGPAPRAARHAERPAREAKGGERSGEAKVGPAHLVEVVLAAPAPRTGGGDRPPLWVQRRAWLSSGAHGRAGETGGAHRACGSIALRPRSRPNPFPNPPGPIPFQKAGDVHVVPAAASST